MMTRIANLLFCFSFLFLASCTKEELNVVGDNTAPEDPTISNITKNNYINRVYIKLLDRKPDSIELKAALDVLNQDPGSSYKRKEVLGIVTANPEYPYVLWQTIRELLLDGTDTGEINDVYRELKEDWSNATGANKDKLEYEWRRMEKILDGAEKIENNLTTWEDLQRAACDNLIYDHINMGTENYVVSVFQNLLHRYPTLEELSAAKDMVDGRPAVLFLESGSELEDFLNIFFAHRSYFEGQVVQLYRDNLFRSPYPIELIELTDYYIEQDNFESLLLEVLSSDTYFN